VAAGLVAALASLARAQTREEKTIKEDMNPRATTTPLKVELTPYWCAICAKNGLIKGDAPPIEMMRKPIATIVEQIGLEQQPLLIVTPHFKIFSTIKGAPTNLTDA